ncbi:MAG TPA: DUF1326 domain-containing protein [Bryobacteraceae bacterium]|nr:DUF1326 domain-containing protein [Bryobacteraceae bacterium]
MLRIYRGVVVSVAAVCVSFAAGIPSRTVRGNYIEARTADVYTGPCFANGEAEQVGREAVFGWRIDAGDWHGVSLDGLSVVGVIRSEHTLGLRTEPINPAIAVLIVDNHANAEQRLALQSFAKSMGGELLKDVVQVDFAPIELTVKDGNIHGGVARLTAGSLASIQTRAMSETDHVCGNEEVWYPPLNKVEHAMPAYAMENSFSGSGLGESWNARLERSGFIGTFQVPSE